MIVVATAGIVRYRAGRGRDQAFGVTMRSRGIAGNVLGGVRSLVAGKVKEHSRARAEVRRVADRLAKNAKCVDVNGDLMACFDPTPMTRTMTEIAAYGTTIPMAPIPK